MRLIRVLVPDGQLDSVADVLDEEGIAYVRQRSWANGDEQWLFECPVPTDAVGYVIDRLEAVGVETGEYTVVTSLTAATHPQVEPLNDRFASDFEPLTRTELRTKARDVSHDFRAFLSLILVSAVIATAGLILDSPAIIVGSMVIAPVVGPVLTASVGAVTGDRDMLSTSVRNQCLGMAAAVIGAAAFSYGLQFTGFVPATLDVGSIELVVLRSAPSLLTVTVGLAAGIAGAFGLATKGPTSLIGVMIAAALIPAAATVGIAAAWGELRIAAGSLLLVGLTLVLINVATYATLWLFGYEPEDGDERRLLRVDSTTRGLLTAGVALGLVVFVAVTAAATIQQMGFERTVNQQVESTVGTAEYRSLEPVSVRIQYAGALPFGSPESVTVTVSQRGVGRPPPLAGELQRQIAAATGQAVRVRVRFISYQQSNGITQSSAHGARLERAASRERPVSGAYTAVFSSLAR